MPRQAGSCRSCRTLDPSLPVVRILPIAFALILATMSGTVCASEESSPSKMAQAHLAAFKNAVRERPDWATRFRVLVELREGKQSESFWLNDVKLENNRLFGRVSAIPRLLKKQALGRWIEISGDQILDWTYEHPQTREISGHFHLCSEWRSLPDKEFKEQKEYWRVRCDYHQ